MRRLQIRASTVEAMLTFDLPISKIHPDDDCDTPDLNPYAALRPMQAQMDTAGSGDLDVSKMQIKTLGSAEVDEAAETHARQVAQLRNMADQNSSRFSL